jgi:hypothetical protein
MALVRTIAEIAKTHGGEWTPQKDGSLRFETVVAERRKFFSRKKLTYICRLRVDESARQVRFFEMLRQSGFGLSGGGDDPGPGVGFKKEVYGTSGKSRTAAIEEQSRLFGMDYRYTFDFGRLREALRRAAAEAGYGFEITLMEKAV